jgi:hypothetical protein
MIRYFDYPWGVGEFPGWKGVGLGSDPPIPRYPSIKSRKSMGIHDPLQPKLSRGGKTHRPCCSADRRTILFLDKRKESLYETPLL